MTFMPVIVHIVIMYICSSCDASSVVGACTVFWGIIMIYRKSQFTKIRLDILYQSIMQCRLFITHTRYACHDMTKSASLRYFTLINFINLHALPPLETYQDCACLCDRLIADWLRGSGTISLFIWPFRLSFQHPVCWSTGNRLSRL